jgi:hypothetical protein
MELKKSFTSMGVNGALLRRLARGLDRLREDKACFRDALRSLNG